ncbi:hypothetical protein VVD49_03875 [Uliginosibacterium sp. H3]|uniref:DUF4012 domain-containing protein n=1 Tax=Uliginosibacterium silvisoli TaxID=3114758 RepID=A0ABU6JZL3_9RHOO|nr:hypothetical protein [Uliginosibacterium sp. H3]
MSKAMPLAAREQIRHVEVLVGVGQNGPLIGDKEAVWQPAAPALGLVVVAAPRVGQRPRTENGYGDTVSTRVGSRGDVIVMLGVLVLVGAVMLVQVAGEMGYDNYRYFMADRALAPIRRNLADYDVGERLRQSFDDAVRGTVPEAPGKVGLVAPATPEHFESRYAMAGGDAVLLVALNYAWSMDLNTLTVAAEANLYPKTPALWQLQYDTYRRGTRTDKLPGALLTDVRHSLYRQVISYGISLPTRQDDRDLAAAAWAADDGARLRGALDEGVNVISRLVSADLASAQQNDWSPSARSMALDVGGKRFNVSRDLQGVTTVTRLPVMRP